MNFGAVSFTFTLTIRNSLTVFCLHSSNNMVSVSIAGKVFKKPLNMLWWESKKAVVVVLFLAGMMGLLHSNINIQTIARNGARLERDLVRVEALELARDTTAASIGNATHRVFVPVSPTDYIYTGKWYESSPIVLESHKLIFFTVPKVGCTIWKQLFRRMMGYKDWRDGWVPSRHETNGLRYLEHYSLEQATELMNSPEYTRAIFVRDPKDRLVSAYLEKTSIGIQNMKRHCCNKLTTQKEQGQCVKKAKSSLSGFLNVTQSVCPKNVHWWPQGLRMEAKYFPLLDFVGHMEHMAEDAERLLKRIGAWEEFGKSGWGKRGKEAIFTSKSGVFHATSPEIKGGVDAYWQRLSKFYTSELENVVEEVYQSDYSIPQFNLTKKRVITSDQNRN